MCADREEIVMIRKVSLILLILCMVLGLCACAQAEEEPQQTEEIVNNMIILEDGRVLYRVTVVNEMAEPMQDVLIGLCLGEELAQDVLTGEDGVAEFICEQDNYLVRILSVPGGYALMDDALTFAAGYSEMKVILPKA